MVFMEQESKRKPSYDGDRQELGKIYPLSTPFTVILDASEACNFRCSYCFRATERTEAWGDYAIKRNHMGWDIFRLAVEQIKEFPEEIKRISLSNHGEPLCNRNLPRMARYIKEQGIAGKTSIHTNASLLDEEYAFELAQCGLDKIVVSLQGLDAENYRRVCGVGIDYDRFYQNLKHLYDNKAPNTVINVKIIDVAAEGREEEFYQRFSPVADTVFVEKMVPIWKNTGTDTHPAKTINKFGEEFAYQQCCPRIFNTIVVTPEGDVYPCTQILSKEKLGNIREQTLKALWNCEKRRDLLRRQLLLCPPESCDGCYIRQNSIFSPKDCIDGYRQEILGRL